MILPLSLQAVRVLMRRMRRVRQLIRCPGFIYVSWNRSRILSWGIRVNIQFKWLHELGMGFEYLTGKRHTDSLFFTQWKLFIHRASMEGQWSYNLTIYSMKITNPAHLNTWSCTHRPTLTPSWLALHVGLPSAHGHWWQHPSLAEKGGASHILCATFPPPLLPLCCSPLPRKINKVVKF